MRENLITIKEAATLLSVTTKTLRTWDKEGKLTPIKTIGGHRRYDPKILLNLNSIVDPGHKITMCYARVSSHDQKKDLQTQLKALEAFCIASGWSFDLISDLGSGLNYKKKGLIRLIKLICSSAIQRLVITNKDRLLRFGSELIFSLCEIFNVEVVIINQAEETSFEEDLTNDVLEIITVFSARLYGSRSHKNKKLIEELKIVADKL